MAKMNDEDPEKSPPHGHITSISVLRSHRKLGLATRLMQASQKAMYNVYEAEYCSLHVRISNRAAIALYRDTLGFEVVKKEEKYYADGEDAYDMRMYLSDKKSAKEVTPEEEKKESEALATGDDGKGAAQQLAEDNVETKKKKRKNKK